jgi:hypothetical protein
MPRIIASPTDITPDTLTAVLRESGALPRGEVVAVEVHANDAFNSTISHLTLTYSDDVLGDAPMRVLLKRNIDTAWAVRANAAEVAFYQLIATLGDDLPMLLRAYAAAHDPVSGKSHLLLPDLSETHETPVERARVLALDGVPDDAQLDGIVDAIAAFHAYWWDHPALGQPALPPSGLYGNKVAYEGFLASTASDWAAFSVAEDNDIPGDLRALYEAALPHLPALWDRYLAGRVPARRHVTLCHGDCYFAAFLCPRESGSRTYIIDWQGPFVDLAARDLNYLFANFWTSAQRQENGREVRLLRRYHGALLAHGVEGYEWDDLVADYRLMLIIRIFLPIWDAVNRSPRAYWWPKLRCLTDAYRDWRCEELLGAAV